MLAPPVYLHIQVGSSVYVWRNMLHTVVSAGKKWWFSMDCVKVQADLGLDRPNKKNMCV